MAGLPDHVHAELRLLYQNAVDNIEFCKKRQWWITNQTLALYAVIYFVSKVGLDDSKLFCSSLIVHVMGGLAIVALLVNLAYR